ncbi:MAG TPA: AbrB/MazE/SpoVT family DNA-binding domain-containing protein [Opitutaceae bacterium]|nr:AbrB/MazE/SpoVT family DNA-binding domain-containing protein [Opitutaceae bacterium]
METTLSTKGQVVLPRPARQKLHLRPGTKFACRLAGRSIILTPVAAPQAQPRIVRDRTTGLMVSRGPAEGPVVTSAQVRAALADFP